MVMNVLLPNMPVYCTASKRTLLEWCIMSPHPPCIIFVEFFDEKYLLAMDKYRVVGLISAHPHALFAGEAPDEKLKMCIILCTFNGTPKDSITAAAFIFGWFIHCKLCHMPFCGLISPASISPALILFCGLK